MAQIRAAGYPATPAELADYYHGQVLQRDATQLWMEVMADLRSPAFEQASAPLPIVGTGPDIPPAGEPWGEAAAVGALLATYRDTLEKSHQAAELGGAARFPLEFEDGLQMLLPHAQEMRSVARLLALEARFKARQGDAAGASRALQSLLRTGHSLENQPVLISQLVRFALHGIAVDTAAELLAQDDFRDEDLRSWQAVLRTIRFKDSLRTALVGERVLSVEAFQHPAMALEGPALLVRPSDDDRACYLARMRTFVAAAQEDFPQALNSASTEIGAFEAQMNSSQVARLRFILTQMVMPTIRAAFSATARGEAGGRALDTLIAVELFRRDQGRLPEQLDELVPGYLEQLPLDPFDGQPLRYATDVAGNAIVYSIGQNLADDQGLDDPANGDIVLRLPVRTGEDSSVSPGNEDRVP